MVGGALLSAALLTRPLLHAQTVAERLKTYTEAEVTSTPAARLLDLLVQPHPDYGAQNTRLAVVAKARLSDARGRDWIFGELVAIAQDGSLGFPPRTQACTALREIDEERGVAELLTILVRDPLPGMRAIAANCLASSPLPAAQAGLLAAREREDSDYALEWIEKALERMARSAAARTEGIREGFEGCAAGTQPAGWNPPHQSTLYQGAVVEEQPFAGRACYRLSPPDAPAHNAMASVSRSIDATPYRGCRLRMTAALRALVQKAPAKAQLYMRVFRPNGATGFVDDMSDRPVTSGEWRSYEIIGDVASDATAISIGLLITGNVKAYLDEVCLETLGPAEATVAEPPRPLSPDGLENLVAFTRLLGYVRHFHPSDQAASADWIDKATKGMRLVEGARDPSDLCQRLEQWAAPVAPTVRVFPTGQTPPLPAELQPPRDAPWIRCWQHMGFGNAEPTIYRSVRKREPIAGAAAPDAPRPDKPFVADLGAGVSCMVPLALYADPAGTLPHLPPRDKSELRPTQTPNAEQDRATRLADVALAWNILQHFYPYFDVVSTDWHDALRQALSAAATDVDGQAFLLTLQRMVARLHDGHGAVSWTGDRLKSTLPIRVRWVENQLVVTDVCSAAAGQVGRGDVIVEWDGQPPLQVLTNLEQAISGATQGWKRRTSTGKITYGLEGSTVKLLLEGPAGERRLVTLRRDKPEPRQHSVPPLTELKPGIVYVDLDRVKTAEFEQAVPQLQAARAIIFDIRGYPWGISVAPLQHLMDQPFTSAQWHVPVITQPDHEGMTFEVRCNKHEPLEPRFPGRIFFLTGPFSISYAETYMGMVEHYKMATIVGEATAGTNGNINPFVLPGGYRVTWTGMKVLKHDGSQHHGVGITPTVPVVPTLKGIAEGRDEVLEKGVQLAEQQE